MTDHLAPDDTSIAQFLSARRKAIFAVLTIVGILVSGQLLPEQADLIVQGIIGVLGVFGVHEVQND